MPANVDTAQEPVSAEPEEVIGADDDAAEFETEAEAEPEPEPASAEMSRDAPEPAAEPEAPRPADAAAKGPAAPEDDATGPTDDVAAEDTDGEDADGEDTPAPAGADGTALPRRELDQNLRAILQEEVAREMAARAADTEPDEAHSATDLGAADIPGKDDTPPVPPHEPAKALDLDGLAAIGPAPMKDRDVAGLAGAPALAAETDKASRKDLFPDIDEINSTLDSHGPEEDFEEEIEAEGQSGFGRGFFAIVFVAALALALYLVAPKLAESMPVLEPALSGYVDAVNGARNWLDTTLQSVTNRIDSAE